MTTEQNYVGGESHATPTEPTAQNTPSAVENKAESAKPNYGKIPAAKLTFNLELLINSMYGTSQAETLIWAIESHRTIKSKEFISAMASRHFLDATRIWHELDSMNSMMLSIATQAVYLAERNHSASEQRPDRSGFDFDGEQERVKEFLREYTRIDPDTVDLT